MTERIYSINNEQYDALQEFYRHYREHIGDCKLDDHQWANRLERLPGLIAYIRENLRVPVYGLNDTLFEYLSSGRYVFGES